MKDDNLVIKSGIWYTICNFFVKGLTFLLMPIFTRIMSGNDIGLYSNIIAWFNILAIVTTFELYSSVSIARFDYKEDLNKYISSSLFLGSLITIGFYAIIFIFKDFFTSLMLIDFKTINIIFIYLLFYPAIQMFQIKNQIRYNYKPIIFITLVNAISSSLLSILLTLICANKLDGRVFGYFVPLIVIAFIVYIYLMIDGKSISKKYWKYALSISFPLIWHLLAGYLLSSADKVMITKMISPNANALYSVAYTISQAVSILWMSMNNAWSPWAYDMMDKKAFNKLKENSKPYLIFFIVIVYLFILITPELLLIMGGNEYINAKYVMPPVMIGYIFQFVYSLYVNIEFYHKKQKNIAMGTMIACLVNIILNFIFIPMFGYIAAAYTTLIGYIVLYLLHYFFVIKLKCGDWYDNKFFVKILILSIIVLLISNFIYYYNSIRYIIILFSIVTILYMIIKNKNQILKALKNKSVKDFIKIFNNKNKNS